MFSLLGVRSWERVRDRGHGEGERKKVRGERERIERKRRKEREERLVCLNVAIMTISVMV